MGEVVQWSRVEVTTFALINRSFEKETFIPVGRKFKPDTCKSEPPRTGPLVGDTPRS